MSKQSYTPGPWKYIETPDSFIRTDSNDNEFEVGVVHQEVEDAEGKTIVTNEFNHCDAKTFQLIAAAPEMLDVLKVVNCGCTVAERLSGHLDDCFMPLVNGAISKAEGRSE